MGLAVVREVRSAHALLLRRALDRVQGADAGQSLVRPFGVVEPGVKEVPTHVHHTPDVRGPARVHRVVPGVPVGVNEPGLPREERGRRVAGAADGQVEHGVGVGGVADVHPGGRQALAWRRPRPRPGVPRPPNSCADPSEHSSKQWHRFVGPRALPLKARPGPVAGSGPTLPPSLVGGNGACRRRAFPPGDTAESPQSVCRRR